MILQSFIYLIHADFIVSHLYYCRCGNAIESCGSDLFPGALTATILTTIGATLHHAIDEQ